MRIGAGPRAAAAAPQPLRRRPRRGRNRPDTREAAAPPASGSLPKVQTGREFVECLEEWLRPAADGGPGRPAGLKSCVIESYSPIRQRGRLHRVKWDLVGTGLDHVKIMNVALDGGAVRQFFLDVADKRLPTLHTNARAEDVGRVVDALADEAHGTFDNMWMHHRMLERIAGSVGGGLTGFKARYVGNAPARAGDGSAPSGGGDTHVSIHGPEAERLKRLLRGDGDFRDMATYRSVSILRGRPGSESGHAQVDILNTGYFAARGGGSARDHLDIVDGSRNIYSRAVSGVEACQLGTDARCEDPGIAGGQVLNFVLPSTIADAERFVDMLFNCAKPFRLGGIKSVVEPGYYKVLAVDLHTGGPLTFEIAAGMMRIYLRQGSCGNTIMRLLTNLQSLYGMGVECREVEQLGG